MAQTAQEKAKEALEISDRKIEKLQAKRDKARADLAAAIKALEAEQEMNAHVAAHPALKSVEEHRESVAPKTETLPQHEY